MAILEPEIRKAWRNALASYDGPWILYGLAREKGAYALSSSVEGMAGLIDWLVHGQVSRLVQRDGLCSDDFCVIPGTPEGKRPHVLLFHYDPAPGSEPLLKTVRKLGIKELALAGTTFPEDFFAKLKQTLKKEGIHFTILEPDSP